MKSLDLSRLSTFDHAQQRVFVKANSNKTVRGVTTHPTAIMVETETSENVLYDVIPPGRFAIELRPADDAVVTFEAPEACAMSIVMEASPLVMHGDLEGKWTVVDHRPAINPEMREVMGQMRQMNHAIGVLSRDNALRRKQILRERQERLDAEREVSPEPTPEPAPEPVATPPVAKSEEDNNATE